MYLLIISFFYYFSRFIVFLFKKLTNKQLYIDLYVSISEYIKTTVPKKTKKIYLYYSTKWKKKILKVGNIIFKYIFRFILFFYTTFLSKIRAFFWKFIIPFQYMWWLKKSIRKGVINYAYNKHKVAERLCKKYELDYKKVLDDKNELYKYLTVFDYIFHKGKIRYNHYFVYLEKHLLDLYTGNKNYKLSYIKILYLNLSRYYLYIFKNIWPHIYTTLAVLSEYLAVLFTFFFNWFLFYLICILSIPFLIIKLIKNIIFKIIKKAYFFFRVIRWFIKTRKKNKWVIL